MRHVTNLNKDGFTLVELLVAMVIALVVITSLASAFISQHKTYDVQEQIAEMTQNARAAMDMITREVKMAGYDPMKTLSLGSTVGVPYSASQMEILADLNGDGETNGSVTDNDTDEDIVYTYDATNKRITRDAGDGPQPFAENIESFSFQYYDEDGNATTVGSDIRQIKIVIVAKTSKPDPAYTHPQYADGYRRYTLESFITPTNLAL